MAALFIPAENLQSQRQSLFNISSAQRHSGGGKFCDVLPGNFAVGGQRRTLKRRSGKGDESEAAGRVLPDQLPEKVFALLQTAGCRICRLHTAGNIEYHQHIRSIGSAGQFLCVPIWMCQPQHQCRTTGKEQPVSPVTHCSGKAYHLRITGTTAQQSRQLAAAAMGGEDDQNRPEQQQQRQ